MYYFVGCHFQNSFLHETDETGCCRPPDTECHPIFSSFLESFQSQLGRSSDLLPVAQPSHVPMTAHSGFSSSTRLVGLHGLRDFRAHSSGTVQDLHLIPFSRLTCSYFVPCGNFGTSTSATKLFAKLQLFFHPPNFFHTPHAPHPCKPNALATFHHPIFFTPYLSTASFTSIH